MTTGATFFLGFWPLILLTMGIFSAMDHVRIFFTYFYIQKISNFCLFLIWKVKFFSQYFGPAFVHRAHHAEASGPHRAGPTDV